MIAKLDSFIVNIKMNIDCITWCGKLDVGGERGRLADESHHTAWHIQVLEEFIFCILIFAY